MEDGPSQKTRGIQELVREDWVRVSQVRQRQHEGRRIYEEAVWVRKLRQEEYGRLTKQDSTWHEEKEKREHAG